ncbi:MAG: hypothetical protein AAF393_05430 [Pseudomonadota bacterium]
MLGLKAWIFQHWRGQAPLGLLAGVNLICVTGLFWAVLTYAPPWLALIACPVAGIGLIWQTVGTVRALDQFLAGSSGLFLTVGICALLLCAIVMLADRSVTRVSALFLDPTLGAYVPPPAQVVLSPDGQNLRLSGEISYPMLTQFDREMTQTVKRVEVQSNGGNVPAARVLASRILDAGLSTHAIGDCLSACTLVFAAGARRTLAPGARLGFHGYAISGRMRTNTSDIAAEEARDRAFLVARGVSEEFVAQAYGTTHEKIWMPERSDALAAGMITHVE